MSASIQPISQQPIPPKVQVEVTGCHHADVITTIVMPILLIIAIGLSIHYILHPVAPLIPIYGNFSMSLPLLITSSAGIALTIALIVQIVRHNQVNHAFAQCVGHQVHSTPAFQESIRFALHPGRRAIEVTPEIHLENHRALITTVTNHIGPVVSFNTRDNVKLKGFWHFHSSSAPTVIAFHGNGLNAEHCENVGLYFKQMGFNVLLVEYRGYGLSEGLTAVPNTEIEAYYDAEAALQFVLRAPNVDKSKIVAYGFSLGGAYAGALGAFYHQHIRCTILHGTFTDFAQVACHASKLPPMASVESALGVCYLSAEAPASMDGARPLKTDGFNTLAKVPLITGGLVVIRGKEDNLMPMVFGEELSKAKQGSELITVEGGHQDTPFFKDSKAKSKLMKFFVAHQILPDYTLV